GTGFSSLTYLKRFPVDIIKVDRGFVAGLGGDAYDSAIVESVVELGHALGLRAVAEGIETDEQLHRLQGLGCDFAQGFLFARPLPAEEISASLRTGLSLPGNGTLCPSECESPRFYRSPVDEMATAVLESATGRHPKEAR